MAGLLPSVIIPTEMVWIWGLGLLTITIFVCGTVYASPIPSAQYPTIPIWYILCIRRPRRAANRPRLRGLNALFLEPPFPVACGNA